MRTMAEGSIPSLRRIIRSRSRSARRRPHGSPRLREPTSTSRRCSGGPRHREPRITGSRSQPIRASATRSTTSRLLPRPTRARKRIRLTPSSTGACARMTRPASASPGPRLALSGAGCRPRHSSGATRNAAARFPCCAGIRSKALCRTTCTCRRPTARKRTSTTCAAPPSRRPAGSGRACGAGR